MKAPARPWVRLGRRPDVGPTPAERAERAAKLRANRPNRSRIEAPPGFLKMVFSSLRP